MKTIVLLVALATQLTAAVTTTLETGYYTKYLAPASGVPLYDDEVCQTQLTITTPLENGTLSFAVWNSSSFNGEWDTGDETDLIISGTYKLDSGYEVRGSAAYFFLTDNENTIRTTLGLFRTIDDWTFGVNVFSFANDGPIGDRWVGHLSVLRTFPITSKLSAALNPVLIYDTGNNFTSDGFLFKQGATLEYKIQETLTVQAGCSVFVPLTVKGDVRNETDAVFWLGFKLTGF